MNSIYLQPFLNYSDNTPPVYKHNDENGHIEPPINQIISIRDGKALSHYGDCAWDLTPYSNGKNILYFNNILCSELIQEAKRLTYLYMTFGQGRLKTLPAGRSISIKFLAIKYLSMYAFEKNKSLFQVLENKKLLRQFIIHIGRKSPNIAAPLKTILELLNRTSFDRSGFLYQKNKTNQKLLISIDKKYKESLDQTLMIPIDIYKNSAKYRWEHIKIILKNKDNLLKFLYNYVNNKAFAISSKFEVDPKDRHNYISWQSAVKQFNLQKLFTKYGVLSRINFTLFLSQIQGTCRHLIHQYTGMRDNECKLLTHECWKDRTTEIPSLISGNISKVQGVKTPQVWITHDNIKLVVDILHSISKIICKKHCIKLENHPLLIRIGLIRNSIKVTNFEEAIFNHDNSVELPINEKELIITTKHIDELKAVEPNQGWENHKWVKVGHPWIFKSHQYRRSLAIYALGSGLVSVYAIKEQFGQLLLDMASYYGNGHKSAKKIDGNTDEREHIANYMNQIKRTMQGLSFIKNVLLSDSPSFGANGIFLEKHIIAKTEKDREAVMKKTPQIIKKFNSGLLHYHETPIGGCMTPEPCDKYLLPNFYMDCKSCDYSIQKLEKIEKLAKKQSENAMKWALKAPNSIEHRTSVRRALALNELRDKLYKKTQSILGRAHE